MKRIVVLLFLMTPSSIFAQGRWSTEQIDAWYKQQGWLVGANYIPYNAINQLEMWQAETFDSARIDLELGWAEKIGMTTMRVFLHDLLWQQDSQGFEKRINIFLSICEKHHIRPLFVLFDSVWDPNPQLGKQRGQKPGVHNSGWVQGPGAVALQDVKQYPRLEAYVKGVVGTFANDHRILGWDIWNEPDNLNTGNYSEPKNKTELIEKLLPLAFDWARSVRPTQPLTSGVWKIDFKAPVRLTNVENIQLNHSDIISFHDYGDSASFVRSVTYLQQFKRPLICTEYLARSRKSTFESILPLGKTVNAGMINWGFVVGKTQTNLPWDSWEKPYINGREPAVWHHEIFYPDGKPYRQEEVDLIKATTGR